MTIELRIGMVELFHATARMANRERTQQQHVDQAEDGGIGADPKRHRDDRNRPEDWRVSYGMQGVADVLQDEIAPCLEPGTSGIVAPGVEIYMSQRWPAASQRYARVLFFVEQRGGAFGSANVPQPCRFRRATPRPPADSDASNHPRKGGSGPPGRCA